MSAPTLAEASSHMVTANGNEVDLRYPRSNCITLADISHHLAQINRFTGACRRRGVRDLLLDRELGPGAGEGPRYHGISGAAWAFAASEAATGARPVARPRSVDAGRSASSTRRRLPTRR